MNAPGPLALDSAPALHRVALAALARLVPLDAGCVESEWLAGQAAQVPALAFGEWLPRAPDGDRSLLRLGARLALEPAELIAVALAMEVELDPMLGRVCAWLQAPVGGARPTLGLVHSMTQAMGLGQSLTVLADGEALRCGLIRAENESRPLPERALHLPLPVALALRGGSSRWPGMLALDEAPENLPLSLQVDATRHARSLTDGEALAVRSGHPREAQLAAALIARLLDRRAIRVEGEPPPGLGPWLTLTGAVPVIAIELAPGERQRLPELPGYQGPLLVATGLEGSWADREGNPVPGWVVPIPPADERAKIWRSLFDEDAARQLGRSHRFGTAHIAHLAQAANREAKRRGENGVRIEHVTYVARSGAAGELGTLAQLLTEDVPEDALVVPDEIRRALDALRQRCHLRENLADGLGPAARTRYRPGVRALFVGPSGTGKSLAVGWLASRLGLPLYRVDLAAVSSKYIGETEKNLAQLFARAEHAEAVLMFDEADALFGKRTDVKDSNDRFANAQTNYLLQRIESFEGIAILTSNSRARFDSAFTRRLDAILEFRLPAADERRALWLAHVGPAQALSAADLNRVASACDLPGGHIRNAVLAAAAGRECRDSPLDAAGIARAIGAEYRKLGREAPGEMQVPSASLPVPPHAVPERRPP